MYIWVACNIQEPLSELRSHCIEANRTIRLNESAFSLPQHISLKISFPVSDTANEEVTSAIISYLSNIESFCVFPKQIEIHGNILWVTFAKSAELEDIHAKLDYLMLKLFDIKQHDLDQHFLFHSTLFTDDDNLRISKMYDLIKSFSLPNQIFVTEFLIGTSQTGQSGSFHITQRIPLLRKDFL